VFRHHRRQALDQQVTPWPQIATVHDRREPRWTAFCHNGFYWSPGMPEPREC